MGAGRVTRSLKFARVLFSRVPEHKLRFKSTSEKEPKEEEEEKGSRYGCNSQQLFFC